MPSFERSRFYGTSNLNALSDGLRVLRTIHAERKQGVRRSSAWSENRRGARGAWAIVSTLVEGRLDRDAGGQIPSAPNALHLIAAGERREVCQGRSGRCRAYNVEAVGVRSS